MGYIAMDGQIGNGVFRESWGWGPVGKSRHGCSEELWMIFVLTLCL